MSDADESSRVLLEEVSPHGTLMALVESANGVVYLYVTGQEGSGVRPRPCWVRNLVPAPKEFEAEAMKSGLPPRLHASACAHPQGAPPLHAERLRVVWFEEGDGAALYEGDELLAVVPPWAGAAGFDGYARDCIAEAPVCWPMKPALETLRPRLARAAEFYRSWEKGNAHWPQVQESFMRPYEAALGRHERYFAIDAGHWPPKAVAVFRNASGVYLLTLGVSIRPQPTVEIYVEDPAPHRRIELAMALPRDASDDAIGRAIAYLSGQADLPWQRFTWLGVGHTIQCEPHPAGRNFSGVLLSADPPGAPRIAMPFYRGDPVNLLWMLPITAEEQRLAEQQDGGGALLLDRLTLEGNLCPRASSTSASA